MVGRLARIISFAFSPLGCRPYRGTTDWRTGEEINSRRVMYSTASSVSAEIWLKRPHNGAPALYAHVPRTQKVSKTVGAPRGPAAPPEGQHVSFIMTMRARRNWRHVTSKRGEYYADTVLSRSRSPEPAVLRPYRRTRRRCGHTRIPWLIMVLNRNLRPGASALRPAGVKGHPAFAVARSALLPSLPTGLNPRPRVMLLVEDSQAQGGQTP